nr:hypothetical protein [uncultured Cohaesibacter sp.]
MISALEKALEPCGFFLRGGFYPEAADAVPLLSDGQTVATVLVVGSVGPRMWQEFQKERADCPDPLDEWTERRLKVIAGQFGAHPVFPFDRPYYPFQRWDKRTGTCFKSPLRIKIHPVYGLWHATRGALLFSERLALPEHEKTQHPCKTCVGTPCLGACPVGAFSTRGLDIKLCANHLAGPDSEDCMTNGCLARRACPVGKDYQLAPEQASFHMQALRLYHKEIESLA